MPGGTRIPDHLVRRKAGFEGNDWNRPQSVVPGGRPQARLKLHSSRSRCTGSGGDPKQTLMVLDAKPMPSNQLPSTTGSFSAACWCYHRSPFALKLASANKVGSHEQAVNHDFRRGVTHGHRGSGGRPQWKDHFRHGCELQKRSRRARGSRRQVPDGGGRPDINRSFRHLLGLAIQWNRQPRYPLHQVFPSLHAAQWNEDRRRFYRSNGWINPTRNQHRPHRQTPRVTRVLDGHKRRWHNRATIRDMHRVEGEPFALSSWNARADRPDDIKLVHNALYPSVPQQLRPITVLPAIRGRGRGGGALAPRIGSARRLRQHPQGDSNAVRVGYSYRSPGKVDSSHGSRTDVLQGWR